MANIDDGGNKIAAKKEKKPIVSRQIRMSRTMSPMNGRNPKICGDCGYRIRSEKHSDGGHHNGNVPPCHRGR